jgi:hypothetical protein
MLMVPQHYILTMLEDARGEDPPVRVHGAVVKGLMRLRMV